MAASVEVGSAHVTVGIDSNAYHRGIQSAANATRQLSASVRGIQGTLDRFRSSVSNSLIATAAYAAGVNAIRASLGGSAREFLAFERGLINVQKTAGLSGTEVAELASRLRFANTEASIFGQALPTTSKRLLEIATVLGQANVTGVDNIVNLTQTIAALGETTDLVGTEAANAFTVLIQNTSAGFEDAQRLAAVITRLGNSFRGGEAGLLSYARRLAASTQNTNLLATDVLALSAVIQQLALTNETAATAIQRTFTALTTAAAQAATGDLEALDAVFQDIVASTNSLLNVRLNANELIPQLAEGRIEGFQTLLDALNSTDASGRINILTTLFGGTVPAARLNEVLGSLAKNSDELSRAVELARDEWVAATAAIDEYNLSLTGTDKQFTLVANRLRDQAKDIGGALTSVALPIAQQFETIQAAVVGVGAALATAFARRRITGVRGRLQSERADAEARLEQARVAEAAAEERKRLDDELITSNDKVERTRRVHARRQIRRIDTEIAKNNEILQSNATAVRSYETAGRKRRELEGRLTRAIKTSTQERLRSGIAEQRAIQAANNTQVAAYARATEANKNFVSQRQRAETVIRQSDRETEKAANTRFNAIAAQDQREQTLLKTTNARIAAERNLAQAGRLSTAVFRGLGSVYNFFGGGLGLVIGGIAAATVAWSLLNRRLNAFVEQSDNAVSSARSLNAELTAGNSALNDQAQRLAAIYTQRDQLNRLAEPYEERLNRTRQSLIDEAQRTGRPATGADAAAELFTFGIFEQREYDALSESLVELNNQIEQIEAQLPEPFLITVQGASQASAEIEKVNNQLSNLPVEIAKFGDQINDLNLSRISNLQFEASIVFDDPFTQDLERAVFAVRERVQGEIRGAQRTVRNLNLRITELQSLLAEANRALLSPGIRQGTREYDLGQEQVTALQRELSNAEKRLELQEAILAGVKSINTTSLETEAIEAAIQERQNQVNANIAQRPIQAIADLTGASSDANNVVLGLDSQLSIQREQVNQANLLAEANTRTAAGLQAQFAIENEHLQRKLDIDSQILASQHERVLLQERISELTAEISSETAGSQRALDLSQQLPGLRQAIADSKLHEIQLRASAAAQADLNDEVAEFAERSRQIAEGGVIGSMRELALEANRFGDGLEDVVAGGLTSLEDQLVRTFETGKFAVEDLARSIATDLIRLLIRTVITARLAAAILGAFPGLAPTSTGAPTPFFHSGGFQPSGQRSAGSPLGGDEFFAILQRGELTVPKGLSRRLATGDWEAYAALRNWVSGLPKFHSGGYAGGGSGGRSGGGGTTINIINESSQPLEAVDDGDYFDGESYIRSIILRDIRRNGSLTSAFRQAVR